MSIQRKLIPLCKLIRRSFKIDCQGLENISRSRNYVFAMNHQSILDIPLALSLLIPITDRTIHVFLSHRFYDALWPIAKPLEMIRINMNRSLKCRQYNQRQLERGIEKLISGNSVLIYPEGIITGGLTSQLIKAQTGVIRLALFSGVPIIPIGIRGSNQAYPFLLKNKNPFYFRRQHPINIRIGQEIKLTNRKIELENLTKESKRQLRRLTDNLMAKLSGLSRLPVNGIK